MVALVLSWLMRLQLGFPGTFSFIDPNQYLQLTSSAGGINGQNEWRRSAGLARRRPLPYRNSSCPSIGSVVAVELDAASISCSRPGCLIMHVNKVHHVTTINRVAKDLGENEDWLFDVANEMDVEDGVIWVYGVGEDGTMAFTDFGIENLINLIKIHKDNPTLLTRSDGDK